MREMIPLSVPNLKGNELEYVTEAIKEEWVSTAGEYIKRFEEKISSYLCTEDAVACQSGTAGLHLALRACQVQPGDLVIAPTLTFIAAVNPIKYVNAEPVFMDCDDSLTMDPKKLADFLEQECEFYEGALCHGPTKRPVTALIIVHVFGNLAEMEAIMALAAQYKLKVIEDATEALGSYYTAGKYKGKFAGTIGDVGVYSFNGNKIITTGGGGMIVSNSKEYLEYCRSLSMQAKQDSFYFEHSDIGYNYRMTNLQAAVGLAQLEQLETFIETKKSNYHAFLEHGIMLCLFRSDIRPNYWFYSYLTEDRDALMGYLNDCRIQTRPVWNLIHTQIMYQEAIQYQIERAYYYHQKIVNVPCSSNLTAEDVTYISDCIKSFQQR